MNVGNSISPDFPLSDQKVYLHLRTCENFFRIIFSYFLRSLPEKKWSFSLGSYIIYCIFQSFGINFIQLDRHVIIPSTVVLHGLNIAQIVLHSFKSILFVLHSFKVFCLTWLKSKLFDGRSSSSYVLQVIFYNTFLKIKVIITVVHLTMQDVFWQF